MMTQDEARRAVEAELQARKLSKPMTPAERLTFCQEMYNRLQFRSRGDRLQDIRGWADNWQALWLG